MGDVKKIATRESYGNALAELGAEYPNMVVLDADLANSVVMVRAAAGLSDAAEEGKIRKVQLCGEDVRYDCNTKPHYHLHCLRCGKIEDYTLPYMVELDNMISDTGFMIESHNIEFLGICRECRQILSKK